MLFLLSSLALAAEAPPEAVQSEAPEPVVTRPVLPYFQALPEGPSDRVRQRHRSAVG